MPDTLFATLTLQLLAWALINLGAAVVGLYARPREFWRGFWFMVGLWGLIDAGIAFSGLLDLSVTAAALAPILRINLGLDGVYLVVGGVLLTRPKPLLKGFGAAVVAQAVFLAAFDAVHLLQAIAPDAR